MTAMEIVAKQIEQIETLNAELMEQRSTGLAVVEQIRRNCETIANIAIQSERV